MNSIGLENPGVRGFIEHELDWLNEFDVVNIVNLGGHGMDDYLQGVSLLNEVEFDILELNISCPNLKAGGMNFGVKTETAREVVRAVRRECRHRLSVKLSPNAEDIVSIARACEEEGADALALTNTFLAMAVDIYRRRPVFENTYAGLSGPAIRPISLRMVHQVAHAVEIPIMGIGGIAGWQDALEFVMAGAAAVQIGTATFTKPDVALDVIEGIENFMKEQKIASISEIQGVI
jgi:dihydroorotate dehydrogenase (NAD+) catalytic subunit